MKQETIAIIGVGATAIIGGVAAIAIVVTMLLNLQSQVHDLAAEVQRTNITVALTFGRVGP